MIAKKYLLWGVAAVAVLMWQKGRTQEKSKTVVEAGMHQDGTNWMGDMWSRLAGTDLVYKGFDNIDGTAQADVSKVTMSQIATPGWPN